jgi:hypothetical protein
MVKKSHLNGWFFIAASKPNIPATPATSKATTPCKTAPINPRLDTGDGADLKYC